MRVQVHTKFCFLCVLTLLFHQCNHSHGQGHSHQHDGHPHASHSHVHSDLQISEAPYVKVATLSPETKSLQGRTLEEEQHFYIQQLFSRYGQKGRLDFKGFQSLLFNLGLGEVKVVGADHEDLGHDHMMHLDLLDMQEGLHSHSSHKEGHGHGHDHGHEEDTTQCSRENTAGAPAEHVHDHDHHHDHDPNHDHDHIHDTEHNHDNIKVKHHDHTHDDIHVQDTHDHVHVHDKEKKHESNHKELSAQPHSHQNHSDHEHEHGDHDQNYIHDMQTGTEIVPNNREEQSLLHLEPSLVPQELPSSPATSRPKKLRRPARVRGQRGRNRTTSHLPPLSDDHDHKSEHSHDGHHHSHSHCLNLTQLLSYYGLNPESLISPSQFTYLCPALLYQIDSRVCIRHHHQMDTPVSHASVWVWLWGFVSITIISLLSLLGVVLVPILNQSCFKFLLTFLVALAVGTLSGDALLHLLPHSQGHHDHSADGHSHNTDLVTDFDGVWKGLTALAGIYLLYIIEHCIGMFKHYKDHGVRFDRKKVSEEGKIGRKLSDHKLNRHSDAEWLHLKPISEGKNAISCDNGHNDAQLTALQMPNSPTHKMPLAPANPHQEHQSPNQGNGHKSKHHRHSHGHGHSHGGNCHSDQEMKDAGIASIAWMVIMGDGMHNFSDGLAIGAAFSANLTGGISTSVAVFCHELPHELGDFAVLLKAGMTVKQAIVYNLLSALMAYVGMLIGTAVGQYTHNVTSWIFAITAGMFLYVALVDMLPEMLHGDSEDHKRCHLGHFFLQNLGMLTGFGIMLLIAIFEDQIVFEFGF
uniref:Solute carrier family 39 member 10 n=1 Tax=Mola mola TaxID=94237 RepID=A0A3Q3W510_MOLML